MRADIWAVALLIGAAACGDAATNPSTDGDGQTGLTGGRGQSGGTSTINPSVALASSTARNCPQRCGFLVGTAADRADIREARVVTEDAEILLVGPRSSRWSFRGGSKLFTTATGYAYSSPLAQNGWGQAVGASVGGDGSHFATAWEPNGSPIVLSDRPYGQPLAGEARAVNDNSVIVGVSGDRAFRTQYREGFRWLAAAGSAAVDVNFNGQVAGYSTVGGNRRATVWAQNGAATDLGTLPGYAVSEAVAISETGIVTGFSRTTATSTDWRGFIWTASEGMKALDPGFVPADVNHWGEVAGRFWATGECAVFYKGYGTLKLPRVTPGAIDCAATSINSWGDVAGYDLVTPNGGRTVYPRAVVWTWAGNESRYGY